MTLCIIANPHSGNRSAMVPYPKFYISYQQIFHSLIIQWGQGMILRVPLD